LHAGTSFEISFQVAQKTSNFNNQACGESMSGGMGQVPGIGRRSKSAIHNLIDGVDGFPLTGTATQNKNARDQLEMRVLGRALALIFAVFAQYDFRDAHGLAAMTAEDTAEMRRQFNWHERLLLREFGQALKMEDINGRRICPWRR
jgi:hypothetical protein